MQSQSVSSSSVQQPKAVLVTGGAGYIGSHACKALQQAGYLPVTYDNLSHGFQEAVQFGPLEQGDVRDSARLAEVLNKYQPIAVLHFAALIKVGESVERPDLYYHNNVFGAYQLLQALLEHAKQTGSAHPIPVVFSSSAAIYGIPAYMPVAENAPQAPINPYGQSKLMTEHMLADYDKAFGLRHVCLRYFNACGASPDGQLGLRAHNASHLIPAALESLMGIRPALSIMGTDYTTPDGTAIRDYIHVTDLAQAHIAALHYLLNNGASVAINLGTGQGFSVRQIISTIEEVTGRPVPVEEKPRRAGDSPISVADVSRVKEIFNWEPHHSNLRTIIETAWNWHKAYYGSAANK